MSRDRRNLLLLAALTIVLFADVLFLGRGFYKGDLFVYHFPMKKVVRDLVFQEGLPQWNPVYQGGQPLAANPAYELFYPPQWLVLLPGYPFGFHLHIVVHFLIAAIGMYLFLRDLEIRAPAAMLGAVAFAFGAPYLSLMIRLPFLFAMTWVPLILMFVRRAVLEGRPRDIALGAIFFGMQALLGEPVTVAQTAAIAISYAVYKRAWRGALAVAIILFAGLLIAAVQLVPAVDFARDSVRSEGFRWVYASNWSTPPVRLLEVVYPRLFRAFASDDGSQAIRKMYPFRVEPFISEIYVGLLVGIAAIAALLRGMRGRWYVVVILAVSIVLAFGEHAPVFRFLHDSGLTKSIRYPEKFLLSGLFVLIVWGAMAVDALQTDAKLRRTAMVLAVVWTVGALLLWLTVKAPDLMPMVAEGKALRWNAYWMMNVARAAAVIALIATAARGAKWWSVAIVVFAIADASFMHTADAARASHEWFEEPAPSRAIVGRASARLFHQGAWDEWESAPLAMSHFLSSGKRSDRVMRDAMFPFAPAAFGFRGLLEKDLDQTSLLVTAEYEKSAQDVKRRTGSWHPWFLETANVRWVAKFITMEEADKRGTPIEIDDIGAHPRYWFAKRLLSGDVADQLVSNGASASDAFVDGQPFAPASARITKVEESPSHVRIEAQADGNAFLVAANTFHKYWRATIDGKEAPVVKTNIAFQGVVVPAGRHVIELNYRNPLVLPSLIVSVVTLIAAIVTGAAALRWRQP